jgi:kinesin family protein 1
MSLLFSADRAKQIKTKAVVNEDPTEKLIRELMEENEMMKKQLAGGSGAIDMKAIREEAGHDNISKEEEAKIRKRLEEEMKANQDANERAMAEMRQSYEVKKNTCFVTV